MSMFNVCCLYSQASQHKSESLMMTFIYPKLCCKEPLIQIKMKCVLLSSSTLQPFNSSLLCVIISQLPSHPVHREPLQCSSAKEDGSVPNWDPGGQTGPVQHQSRWVWMAAVARKTQGQDPRQGKVRAWVYHKALRSTVWMFKMWLILLGEGSQTSGDYLSSTFYYLQSRHLADFKGRRWWADWSDVIRKCLNMTWLGGENENKTWLLVGIKIVSCLWTV